MASVSERRTAYGNNRDNDGVMSTGRDPIGANHKHEDTLEEANV